MACLIARKIKSTILQHTKNHTSKYSDYFLFADAALSRCWYVLVDEIPRSLLFDAAVVFRCWSWSMTLCHLHWSSSPIFLNSSCVTIIRSSKMFSTSFTGIREFVADWFSRTYWPSCVTNIRQVFNICFSHSCTVTYDRDFSKLCREGVWSIDIL